MTGMHPRAVGTLGPEMLAWAETQRLHVKKTTGYRWWQKLVANRALEVDRNGKLCWRLVIVSAPRQAGKDLSCATPILTTTGWKTMGTVQPGDRVYGPDGRPTRVIAASETFTDHRCYEVTFTDGATLMAGEDHQWAVIDKDSGPRVMTTGQIAATRWGPGACPFRLPRKAAQFCLSGAGDTSIAGLREVPTVPTRCISVDNPDHVYLAGHYFTPTHNSWLERTICAWRINQAERFGEEQSLLHVAHKLIAAQEIWRPAARWATGLDGAQVRWANGEQHIQLADGSRWMIQAATDGAGVAFSLAFALLDEAWRIPRRVFDEAIEPTMAESESPQAWLVSTAGTSESDLMLVNRSAAIAAMDDPGDILLLEWSAPPDPDLNIDSEDVWRACQPHWDDRRAERLAEARAKVSERAFRQQWLNMWVPGISGPLLGEDVWRRAGTVTGRPGDPVSFGVMVAADRLSSTIAAYGAGTAELVQHAEGVSWAAPRLAELAERHQPAAVGIPKTGPSASVCDEAEKLLGPLLVKMTAGQLQAASGKVHDRLTVDPPALRLRAGDTMAEAVRAVERKPGTAGWSWSLDGAGQVMSAVSAAVWASDHAVSEPPLIVV